jgi:hypothetical protein
VNDYIKYNEIQQPTHGKHWPYHQREPLPMRNALWPAAGHGKAGHVGGKGRHTYYLVGDSSRSGKPGRTHDGQRVGCGAPQCIFGPKVIAMVAGGWEKADSAGAPGAPPCLGPHYLVAVKALEQCQLPHQRAAQLGAGGVVDVCTRAERRSKAAIRPPS